MSPFEIPLQGSFKRQIILTFVVGFFFLIASFATYLVTTERDNLHRDSVNETTSMAQSLAASALPWVLANDVAGLQETVNAFHAYPEFIYAMVISPTGEVLAHSDPTKVGLYMTDEQSLALIKAPHDNRLMEDSESTIDVAVPIEIGGRHVGWARVGSSKKENADNLRKMIWSNAFFLLFATAFSFMAAMLIANRLGQRIGSLVQVAEDVQAGNFDTRVNISNSKDEIAKLGNSLNKMLDTLSQNEIDLRKAALYTRSLIEASVDPLVTISAEGKITDVNEATEKITGSSRVELIGTDFSDYFTEPEKAREGYQQVFARGSVTDYPLILRHRDGHTTEVIYNASVYRTGAGEVLGVFAAAREVTESMRVKKELQESEQKFRTLAEAMPQIVWITRPDGWNIYFNQQWVDYTGMTLEESYGHGWNKPFHPDDQKMAWDAWQNATQTDSDYSIECRLRRADGAYRWWLIRGVSLHDANGKIINWFGTCTDIEDIKQAQLEREQYFKFFNTANDLMGIADPNGAFKKINHAFVETLGYSEDELLAKPFIDFVHPDDRQSTLDEMARQLQRGFSLDFENRYLCKDGSFRWLSWKANVNYEEGLTYATARDITERRLTEERLRDSEKKFRSMTDTSPLAIYMSSGIEQKAEYINPTFTRLFGYTLEEVPTVAQWWPLAYPDEKYRKQIEEEWQRKIARAIETNSTIEPMDVVVTCKDGSKKNILWGYTSTGVQNWAFGLDLTERKKAEEKLRHSEASLAEAQRMAHLGNWNLDLTNNVLTWSDEIYRIFEIDPKEFGASYEAFLNAIHPDDRELVNNAYTESLKNRTPYDIVHRLQMKDGRIKFVNERCETYYGDDGKPLRSVGMVHDITERKLAEDEVMVLNRSLEARVTERTAQLEAANKELEAFSYSVSHDLRAPLRAIDGFSHILLEDYASKLDDEGKRLLNVVRENTVRMAQLIDDILKFSRTGRLEMSFSEINMEGLVHEVYEELPPAAAGHELQVEIGKLPPSQGDRAMMRQVFVNLLSNAIKFTRAKEPAKIKVGATFKENEVIYFVQDNGAGFDMHYVDRLFGVFQRLHAESEFEGSGIGLAIVKRIITRHGGRVWAEGKINEGATIYFALPAVKAAPES